MPHRTHAHRFVIAVALAALSGAVISAHTYIGLEDPVLARARVQSPNSTVADFPIPIPGTNLSVVCFRVRNTSPFDSRITAIGLELPGDATGYTLLSPIDGPFHLIEQVSHVPQLRAATLDFALVTGRTFGGGDPNVGLAPSATLTQFCVSGPFPAGVAIEQLLNWGALRMQRVGVDGEAGDVLVWESR